MASLPARCESEENAVETFNVRDFGAFGNGQADDRRAIQQAIDAASQFSNEPHGKGGIVDFSPGHYRTSGEIIIEAQSGLRLRGVGAFAGTKLGLGHLGPRVSLVWDPSSTPSDPCLLRMLGCAGLTIENISFFGSTQPSPRGNVTLLKFEDLGSSKSLLHTLRNVHLYRAERGIVVSGGSDMVFERIGMIDVGTGFKTVSGANANYLWNMLSGLNSTTLLDVDEGGCINAYMVQTTGCGGTGTDEWCLKFGGGGPAVRCSRIECLRIEDGSKQILRIEGDHRVLLASYTQANPENTIGTMRVDGGALTLHACCFQQTGVIHWAATSRNTTVRFRDCEFPTGDPLDMINTPSTSGCFYSFERCDEEWLHIPIEDMKNAW